MLALLGQTVTTDHISPAGAIPRDEPAGRYLQDHGVTPIRFNTFGARRGNHEVMMRGTFGNVRMRNLLLEDKEGGYTVHMPSGEMTTIFEAAERYRAAGTPLVVIAGREYGTGSSRDWAAKGTMLLGVRAVIAESYERIHRSNLVGMGVLPLQFRDGEGAEALGLNGTEFYDIAGIAEGLEPGGRVSVTASREDGSSVAFQATVRLDSEVELDYYRIRRNPAHGAAETGCRVALGLFRTCRADYPAGSGRVHSVQKTATPDAPRRRCRTKPCHSVSRSPPRHS